MGDIVSYVLDQLLENSLGLIRSEGTHSDSTANITLIPHTTEKVADIPAALKTALNQVPQSEGISFTRIAWESCF